MKPLWVAFKANDVNSTDCSVVMGDEEFCRDCITEWTEDEPGEEFFLARLTAPYKRLVLETRIVESIEEVIQDHG